MLLQHGAAVDATGPHGDTPLHIACAKGNEGVARVLLQHGAPVNALNNYGCPPLRLARSRGDESIVSLLLQHGADVESQKPPVMHCFKAICLST